MDMILKLSYDKWSPAYIGEPDFIEESFSGEYSNGVFRHKTLFITLIVLE